MEKFIRKITLEEFAARLGKKGRRKKSTNDLVDIVLHGQPVISNESDWGTKAERLSNIADRAFEKKRNLCVSIFCKNLKIDEPAKSEKKAEVKKSKPAAKRICS